MLTSFGQFIPYGFWISPKGEIHTILDAYGHKKFMEKYLGHEVQDTDDMDNTLFDDGWIRIVNTEHTFMVNYKCITCHKQLEAIKAIDKKMESDGIFHNQYILDYGYDYHFFDDLKQLLRRIKERLYIE